MQTTKRTYFKALLLTLVFSLNTIVSFACSFSNLLHGIHHHETATAPAAEHQHSHNHHSSGSDKHEHDDQQHQHSAGTSREAKDDCCSESVVEIEKVEKAVSRSIEAPQALFIASFFATYASLFQIDTIEDASIPTYIRWRLSATIPDLRIVIQSFQI